MGVNRRIARKTGKGVSKAVSKALASVLPVDEKQIAKRVKDGYNRQRA